VAYSADRAAFAASITIERRGRLAQLVERLPYKQEVGGSSPSPPIEQIHANLMI
jgi:hypothetical protein